MIELVRNLFGEYSGDEHLSCITEHISKRSRINLFVNKSSQITVILFSPINLLVNETSIVWRQQDAIYIQE